MELKFVKNLPSGSNCEADLFRYRVYDIVVKYCGNKSFQQEFGKLIITDYFRIKNYVSSSGISVPETYDMFLSDYENADLYIIESYMGDSLKEIIRNVKNSRLIDKYIKNCREFIESLPEEVSLDVNPGNLAIDDNEQISLIDFIPPDQWKYRETKWEKEMIRAFETTSRSFDYKEKRHVYLNTSGRLKRFDMHVEELLRSN